MSSFSPVKRVDTTTKVPDLSSLKIASAETINAFIKNHNAYFEKNPNGLLPKKDMPYQSKQSNNLNQSDRKSQTNSQRLRRLLNTYEDTEQEDSISMSEETHCKPKRKRERRRIDGVKFNSELSEAVEQGEIQLFDCPPLNFSPTNMHATDSAPRMNVFE